MVAEIADYIGTVALDPLTIGPNAATALALSCWSDSFTLHGIQPLPTPPQLSQLPRWAGLHARSDTGDRYEQRGGGGHGHPRFLWQLSFEPSLHADVGSLLLSTAEGGEATDVVVPLPSRPRVRCSAPAHAVAPAGAGLAPFVDRDAPALPDRVIAVGADLGVIAGARRVVTTLYCWPSWFMMTMEVAGDRPSGLEDPSHGPAWAIEDDLGNRYQGRWIGGWSGALRGAHLAFGPAFDVSARHVRVDFTDILGSAGPLSAEITVPEC